MCQSASTHVFVSCESSSVCYDDIFFLYLWIFFLTSDLKIKVGGRHINAHKFVLAARSDSWSLASLSSTEELDLSGEPLTGWGLKNPSTRALGRRLWFDILKCLWFNESRILFVSIDGSHKLVKLLVTQ